ncbi:molecular chaperone, heat shock protein [unidentified eubacterium SCB49]|nr:molecular chaperone, heat shock protein [unidentified eubacterium SCB49]
MSNKDLKDEVVEDTMENNPETTSEAENKETSVEKEAQENEEKDPIEVLEGKLQGEKDRYLRLFAEFENYKKRTMKERIELFKTAGQDVMISLLPVLDDFDRALKDFSEDSDDVHVQGMQLISNKLKDAVKQKGLELSETNVGDVFDADLHEAITQIPAPSDDMKGKIIDVIEKGYKLGDKIIRYPKVVIGQS